MSSLSLRLISCCCFLAVLLPAIVFPGPAGTSLSAYQIAVRAAGGMVLSVGGIAFVLALENTLLQAGGNISFKLLHLAASGASAIGVSQCISCFYPVNMSLALVALSSVLIVAGLSWWRFYYAAAG